jgi:5-(carboxyamino)imidazole ribonucleotide synthase
MVNLIGTLPDREAVLAGGEVHLHDYGKKPRPGRKLGHCTVVVSSATARDRRARRLLAQLAPGVAIP